MVDKKNGLMRDVKDLMEERLQDDQMTLLRSIAKIADRKLVKVYVVGGFVRDFLLNIQTFDTDLAVEGDGIAFAETLARELNGFSKNYSQFGTSVVVLKDRSRIDVAMTREEHYPLPGDLPKVKPSSIKVDLARRDFTINSMAIELNGPEAFCLIDFFNGERDLKSGVIRVLHDRSFIEDPCRIFRLIRFEQRFNFSIENQTKNFMKCAISRNLINGLSGKRLANELKLLLNEPHQLRCVSRMRELSLIKFIAPSISNDDSYWLTMKKIDGVLAWANKTPISEKPAAWLVYFYALFFDMKDVNFEQAMKRLHISVKTHQRLRLDRAHLAKSKLSLNNTRDLKPSEIYEIFSELSTEAIILFLAICSNERVSKYATRYFNQYCISAKTELTGDDLIQIGIKPGPIFQDVFKALRDARINGLITTREEEVVLVESRFLK